MGPPKGNDNAHRGKLWTDALRKAALADGGKQLRKMASALVNRAAKGDIAAAKEVGDRLEGKAALSIVGPDGGPVQFEEIVRKIV